MGRRVIHSLVFLQLGLILCSGSVSGSSITEKEAIGPNKLKDHSDTSLQFSSPISTTQLDITTPIITPTTPTITPTTPTIPAATPTATPVAPATMTPATTTLSPPVSSSASWCIASQTAAETALQVALDYACGYGGADCSAIQSGGSCYNPNTLHDHASFAFNQYYQKNPLPTSCSFGGTAVVTSTDPSSGTCQYPSTSTSSSVLNTTNPGGSTVFGSQPASSSSSATAMPCGISHFAISTCLTVLIAGNRL